LPIGPPRRSTRFAHQSNAMVAKKYGTADIQPVCVTLIP